MRQRSRARTSGSRAWGSAWSSSSSASAKASDASASSEAANWIEVGFVELRGLAGPVLAYEPLAAPLKATLVRDADSDEPRS